MAELKDVLLFLAGAWPGEMSEAQVFAYKEMFTNENPDKLMEAIRELVKVSKWRPVISEILDKVEGLTARKNALDPNVYYWQAMTAFNDSLAGRVDADYPYQLRGAEKYFHAPSSEPEGWQP